MAGYPDNVFWCPPGLAACWWQPFLVDGFSLENIDKDLWGHAPKDIQDAPCHIIADVAHSRRIICGAERVDVIVFRDNGWSPDPTNPLWIAYFGNTKRMEEWVSRVLVASGAKLLHGRTGYKLVFSCSNEIRKRLEDEIASIGMVSSLSPGPDKHKWEKQQAGVAVALYSGCCIDYRAHTTESYLVINYEWRWFGRGKLRGIINELVELMVSIGCKSIDVERYCIVRNRRGLSNQ